MSRPPTPLTDAELAVVARRVAAGTWDELDAGLVLEQLEHARAALRTLVPVAERLWVQALEVAREDGDEAVLEAARAASGQSERKSL